MGLLPPVRSPGMIRRAWWEVRFLLEEIPLAAKRAPVPSVRQVLYAAGFVALIYLLYFC